MKESVIIKSNQYGITLVLDKEISFEQLVRDICTKFAKARDFFGTANMVLSIEGRPITGEEAGVIVEAIQLNSNISILLVEEKQELKDVQMMDKIDRFYYEKTYENAKILKRNVANKEVITSDSSVIILGDVKSKATVKAAGNVIVMGTVHGAVHAGYPNDAHCYIIAGDWEGTEATVGGVSGEVSMESKWFQRTRRKGQEPVAIVVWQNELLCEPLQSGLLKHI